MKSSFLTNIYWFIAILLLLPLFKLGIWNRHDWGDDFAQYLLQARNIIDWRPQVDNGLVFPTGEQKYAVTAYPVGFPLLLAPVYALYGLDVSPYLVMMTITFFVTGLSLFYFFKRSVSPVLALLLMLWFCFNPFVIEWKWQILSDLPFLLLIYLSIVLYPVSDSSNRSILLWGIFCGFVASVRIVGWCLPISLALVWLISIDEHHTIVPIESRVKRASLLMVSAAVFFLLLNKFVFGVPVFEFAGFYSNALQRHSPALFLNLDFYKQLSAFCFPLPFGWGALPWWWILIALCRWFYLLFRRRALPELFFLVYGIVLLFYPYQNGGLRFLIPLMPLLMYYLVGGMASVLNPVGKQVSVALLFAGLVICVLGNKDFISQILDRRDTVIQGPQDDGSRTMLSFVRDSLPDDALLVFCKPRALSLYGKKRVTAFLKDATPQQSEQQFKEMGVNYLLCAKVAADNELYNPKLDEYLNVYSGQYATVWENNDYRIVKRK